MARIIDRDQRSTTDFSTIAARLAPLRIALRHWPAPDDARSQALLAQPALDAGEQAELLNAVEHRFETLRAQYGYAARDLIVLHEGIENLSELLGKFERIHLHTDDEVRYVLAGAGYFGFIEPTGGQFLLEVSAGDYINVPARTEHWFSLRGSQRIKAVRYFMDDTGWSPQYTGRAPAFD